MIGVGALGAFALYRLVSSRPTPRPTGEEPVYSPPPVGPPPPGGPGRPFGNQNWIGRPPAKGGASILAQGELYRGRTDDAPRALMPGETLSQAIQSELTRFGFTDVRVYTEAEARGTDVMPLSVAFEGTTPSERATESSRFFTATWPHAPQAGMPPIYNVPPWLVLLFPRPLRSFGFVA